MGHANLSNISVFFINRLYAKGKISINQCVAALQKAGETLHASEGEYGDESMLAMGVMDVIEYLMRKDPSQHGYSGPHGGGPWIEPVLTPWFGKGKLDSGLKTMLKTCEANEQDKTLHLVTADRLEEAGQQEWAEYLRLLPEMRVAFAKWKEDEGEDDWWDEVDIFYLIPWRFTEGTRRNYRDVPRLSNVTH